MENVDCIVFRLKTYENQKFWQVEDWKTLTVLICWLKTYENHGLWEVEQYKTLTVLLFWLNTYETRWILEVEVSLAESFLCLKIYENHRF